MCGRYAQTRALQALAKRYKVLLPDGPELDLVPRYNVAPSQDAPVVVPGRVALMRWGLIPSWAKDASIAYKTINARSETISEKPAFKRAYEKTRCLVPADAFYEWRHEGKKKQPLRIAPRDGAPFSMAGLWDKWQDPSGREIRSFTIVTVPSNGALSELHDRMPAILRPEDEGVWLDPRSSREALERALTPVDAATLDLQPASARLNSVANEGPDLWKPDEPSQPDLTLL